MGSVPATSEDVVAYLELEHGLAGGQGRLEQGHESRAAHGHDDGIHVRSCIVAVHACVHARALLRNLYVARTAGTVGTVDTVDTVGTVGTVGTVAPPPPPPPPPQEH